MALPEPFPRRSLVGRVLETLHRHLDPDHWVAKQMTLIETLSDDDLRRFAFSLVRDHVAEHDILEAAIERYATIDFDQAYELMRYATTVHTLCPRYHFFLGMLCREERRFDAVFHIRQACELDGEQNVQWLWHLAVAELEVGDYLNAFGRVHSMAALEGGAPLADLLRAAIMKDDVGDGDDVSANLLTRIEVQLTAADPPKSIKHDIRRLLEKIRPWYEPQDIGEHLLEHAMVRPWQLKQAREVAEKTDRPLLDVLLEDNVIDSIDVTSVTARHYELPEVTLGEFDIEPEVLSLVPADVARRYGVIPVHAGRDSLVVAISEVDRDILSGIGVLTGKRIRPVLTSERLLEIEIERCYGPARDLVVS